LRLSPRRATGAARAGNGWFGREREERSPLRADEGDSAHDRDILDGTEEVDIGVELEDR
jgi:hypothetical protein